MTKENLINLIENKKPVELVQELKDYEIKKSSLSVAARSKVINKSGSDYVSGNKGDYGPGSVQSSYSDDSGEAKMKRYYGKATTSTVTSIVSKAAGPAGVIASGITGAATTVVSEIGYALSSDSDTKDAWKYASELGQDMMTGFVVGNTVDSLRLPYGIKKGWDLWQDFKDKGGEARLMTNYHVYHIANGEKYSSYCDVCKS